MKWRVNDHRGLEDHLGPSPDMRSGGDHMIGLTISPKGLGASLPNKAKCSVIYVEVPI